MANQGVAATKLAPGIENGTRRVTAWLEARPGLILAVFSVLYCAGEGSYASAAALSHDEVWTLLVTKLPGWSGVWEGLAGGADFHPPLHYMLAQSGRLLLDGSLLGFRLSSLFGFWLFSICVFAFVMRRCGVVFAAIAMMAPFAAATQHSPYLARGYALMLGFNALAMLCWQRSSAGRLRPLALAGLGISIFLAAASHYYGVLIVACLAVAEIASSKARRRIDKAVWLAMGAGVAALASLWPLIEAASQHVSGFWATPSLEGLLTVYQYLLSEAVSPAVCAFLAILLFDRILGRRAAVEREPRGSPVPDSEYALAITVSLLPFIVFALAKAVTNAFAVQYVLPTVAGLAICFVFHASERLARRELAGLVLFSCFFGWFVIQQRYLFLRGRELAAQPSLAFPSNVNFDSIDPERKLAIVAPNRVEYLQFVHYWPVEYSRRLYLLTPDSGPPDHLEALARWSELRVRRYREFVQAQGRFLVYGTGGEPGGWVLRRLAEEGARIELKGWWADQPLFEVTVSGG